MACVGRCLSVWGSGQAFQERQCLWVSLEGHARVTTSKHQSRTPWDGHHPCEVKTEAPCLSPHDIISLQTTEVGWGLSHYRRELLIFCAARAWLLIQINSPCWLALFTDLNVSLFSSVLLILGNLNSLRGWMEEPLLWLATAAIFIGSGRKLLVKLVGEERGGSWLKTFVNDVKQTLAINLSSGWWPALVAEWLM